MDLFCRTARGGIMIHIDLKPEPADFDARVRQPGNAFLSTTPTPNSKQWRKIIIGLGVVRNFIKHMEVCVHTAESGFRKQLRLFPLTIFIQKAHIRKRRMNGTITD